MNKRLGQHFLKNKSAVQKIISALDLKSGDKVVEIGPGKGALTFPILEQCKKLNCELTGIEKDPRLVEELKEKIGMENFEIIQGDALKIIPDISGDFKLIGNIPYYITGKLLRILSDLEIKPKVSVLMIQKEVAERLSAEEGRMNLLAAAVRFWSDPELLLALKPGDFSPSPKVESTVIRLTPRAITKNQELTTNYYRAIRIIFKQPRKTLINNLKEGTDLGREELENALLKLKIDQKSRPQDLSVEKIKNLATIINK